MGYVPDFPCIAPTPRFGERWAGGGKASWVSMKTGMQRAQEMAASIFHRHRIPENRGGRAGLRDEIELLPLSRNDDFHPHISCQILRLLCWYISK